MPPPTESVYFHQQRPRCHSLEKDLTVAILAIGNGTGTGVPVKMTLQGSIHQAAQTKDHAAPKSKVFGHALGKTEWSVYYCASATGNKDIILMVGKPLASGGVFPFFDWITSADDRSALDGAWDKPDDLTNDIDMTFTGALKYAHENKHFDPKKVNEAQYTIGTGQNRKNIVAGMEEKAIEHGFGSGERFFWFSEIVGKDPKNDTHCIRVDTPGGPTQHSHPIPETGSGTVSHDGKVVAEIAFCTREKDLAGLVSLAKYLKLIGKNNNAFPSLRSKNLQWGGLQPPTCAYWSW